MPSLTKSGQKQAYCWESLTLFSSVHVNTGHTVLVSESHGEFVRIVKLAFT